MATHFHERQKDISMTDKNTALIIPGLARVYASLDGVSLLVLRIVLGVALAIHGWPKINDPFGAVGMVEQLGFYPGVLFSPLLATTEFFGGILLAIGLLVRPAAAAATFVLLVTVWFHWITLGQGWAGAEKSIIWAAATSIFLVRGGGGLSLDRKIGREF